MALKENFEILNLGIFQLTGNTELFQ
jgi:hypothetical protein